MKYLLDTDTCIYAIKGDENILRHVLEHHPDEIGVSVITEAELRTGAAKSSSKAKTLRRVERFLSPIHVLEFTSHDAVTYADLRAKLERKGTPIGPHDMLIASQAFRRGVTVVTNNEREFRRVRALRIANWSR